MNCGGENYLHLIPIYLKKKKSKNWQNKAYFGTFDQCFENPTNVLKTGLVDSNQMLSQLNQLFAG